MRKITAEDFNKLNCMGVSDKEIKSWLDEEKITRQDIVKMIDDDSGMSLSFQIEMLRD